MAKWPCDRRTLRLSRRAVVRLTMGAPLLLLGCKRSDVTIEYDATPAFSFAERRAIQACAEPAIRDVRKLLPQLPKALTLVVRKGSDVIPETGETAMASPPDTIDWTVDPTRSGGVIATVKSQLRATLHHELHHLVRDAAIRRASLMDHVVAEGLGTAFERDFAAVRPPWGDYPADAVAWVAELRRLPKDAPMPLWVYGKHEDGRRWVGLRAGTYLADRASKALGKTSAELVLTPTEAILEAASRG
jgi:hypothetical protein